MKTKAEIACVFAERRELVYELFADVIKGLLEP
jgi:hypothetical protein